MIHYVLLKFAAGTDLDAAEALVRETYGKLEETLEYLHEPKIFRNCVERDSNADLMVSIRLDSPGQLQSYLTHPLHVSMGKTLNPSLVNRVSFDHP